jgi:hypothetical protein
MLHSSWNHITSTNVRLSCKLMLQQRQRQYWVFYMVFCFRELTVINLVAFVTPVMISAFPKWTIKLRSKVYRSAYMNDMNGRSDLLLWYFIINGRSYKATNWRNPNLATSTLSFKASHESWPSQNSVSQVVSCQLSQYTTSQVVAYYWKC